METLANPDLATPITWDRYDPTKRKIIDPVLARADPDLAEEVRVAILEADSVGAKRRFVVSTMARVSPSYYRSEASGVVRPPQGPDLERLLGVTYDIRSRRSHVLQDLGPEAWAYSDGAETVFEPTYQRILTLAGLWRLVRHVVRHYVANTPKPDPEPYDYRPELPGVVQMILAPQYWIGKTAGFDQKTAPARFEGVVEALTNWLADDENGGFNLTPVVERIERLVPGLADSDAKTAMVGIYALWHSWTDPEKDHRPNAADFLRKYGPCLDVPSPIAFTVGLLSKRGMPDWSGEQLVELATTRRAERGRGKGVPLPATVDATIQVQAADQLEAADRHDEAVVFAANAIEGSPGYEPLMRWDERLLAGDHDSNFDWRPLILGRPPNEDEQAKGSAPAGGGETAD